MRDQVADLAHAAPVAERPQRLELPLGEIDLGLVAGQPRAPLHGQHRLLAPAADSDLGAVGLDREIPLLDAGRLALAEPVRLPLEPELALDLDARGRGQPQKSGSSTITASRSWWGPKTSSSSPSGPASKAR